MKNSIIYLGYLPLTRKIVNDFCLSVLINHGFDVVYWDLSALFFKQNNLQDVNDVDNVKIVKIHTYSRLISLIKEYPNSLYIVLMSFNGMLLRLFFYLSKFNCMTMTFSLCSIPFHLLKKKKNIIHKLLRLKVKSIVNKLSFELMKFLINHRYVKYFDYVLTSGNINNTFPTSKIYAHNTTILCFNTTDYNIFINNQHARLMLSYKYILFIDEYYPFHPDILLFNGESKLNPCEYYKQINSTFEIFEKKYSMPVVIAAHPKAVKYRENNFFNNRLVFFDKTSDLVRGCEFVISHDSTALNYAVFNMKPVFLLKSSIIKKALPDNYDTIDNLALFLKSYIYDMDKMDLWKLPNKVDLSDNQHILYSNLINKYHKAENSTQSNEELILKYVKEIFHKKNVMAV